MVDAHVELILARDRHRGRSIDRRARHVGIGNELDDGRPDRVPATLWDHPLACGVPAEFRPPRGKRVNNCCAEQSGFLSRRRHLAHAWNALLIAQSLIVCKPESAVLDERATDRRAELIAFAHRFRSAKRVGEEVVGVERVIAQEFINAAVDAVGPRFDRGVDHRARASPELRRVSVGLNLELLQRFDRRLHELHVFTAE